MEKGMGICGYLAEHLTDEPGGAGIIGGGEVLHRR